MESSALTRYIQAVNQSRFWLDDDRCLIANRDGSMALSRPVNPSSRWARLLGSSRLYSALWGKPEYRARLHEAQKSVRTDFQNALENTYGTLIASRAVGVVRGAGGLSVADARHALGVARAQARPMREANEALVSHCVAAHASATPDLEARVAQRLGRAMSMYHLSQEQVKAAICWVEAMDATTPMGSVQPVDFERSEAPQAPGIPGQAPNLSEERSKAIMRFAATGPAATRNAVVVGLCDPSRRDAAFDHRGVVRGAPFGALVPASFSAARLQARMEKDMRERLEKPLAGTGFKLHETAYKDCNRDRFFVGGKRLTSVQAEFAQAFRAGFGPEGPQSDAIATLASRFMCQTNTTRMTDILNHEIAMPVVKEYTTFHEAFAQPDGSWDLMTTFRCNASAATFPGIDEVRAFKSPPAFLYTLACTLTPHPDGGVPLLSGIRAEAVFTSQAPAVSTR